MESAAAPKFAKYAEKRGYFAEQPKNCPRTADFGEVRA
jgi:hypothetical protein